MPTDAADFPALLRAIASPDAIIVASLPAQPRPGQSAREFLHPTAALHWHNAAPPSILAAENADASQPGTALWPGSAQPDLVRHRRLDFLYPEATLIGIGDLAAAASVLVGAEVTLHSARPLLVIDTRAPRRATLLAAALRHLPAFYTIDDTHPVLVAAPCTLPRVNPPRPTALDYPFDASLHAYGLHPPEPDAPDGGRYTGAAEACFLCLNRPFGTMSALRLHVADWGPAGPFALSLDGQTLLPRHAGPGIADYGPADLSRVASPMLIVHLLVPPPVIDTVRWPRKIGARLRQLSLRPA